MMESSSQTPAKPAPRALKINLGSIRNKRSVGSPYTGEGKHEDADQHIAPASGSQLESTIHHSKSSARRSKLPLSTMQIPKCMLAQDAKYANLMVDASRIPPCTTETLRELDLPAIQQNLNLRVDLNYDHDLFFQPISGKKGDAKRAEAEKFWLALTTELKIYFHNLQLCSHCEMLPSTRVVHFEQRLPTMFRNLKEIVIMLVPETEHELVASKLNDEFLMQQISHGVLDMVSLTEWLTSLLTSHCAPMRDETAKNIAAQIRNGAEQADMHAVTAGIEKLFGLLELMKLDVANHQIRTFRYPLIEDTVPFQRECFTKAIENRTLDTSRSRRWFRQARESHDRICAQQLRDCRLSEFRALIHGIVKLCNPTIKRVPTTLQYDYQRIVRLQEDLQDLVQIELCLQVFERRIFELDETISHTTVQSAHDSLKSRIICLTEDEEGNGGAISDHLDAISIELTRSIFALQAQVAGKSIESISDLAIHDFEFERTNKVLYEYFQDEDDEELVTAQFLTTLEARAVEHALQFLPLSTLDISNKQRQWTQSRNKSNVGKPYLLADWEDMARRVAHIGTVHWQVWADLCYLKEDSIDNSEDLTSPVSVHGDERFYGDELELYSPSVSSSSSTLSSPLTSQQPFINSEFQQGIAAMQQNACPGKDTGLSETALIEFGDVLEQDFDSDIVMDASSLPHKSNVRRGSM